MSNSSKNPFEVTKASDFSDAEILETWVDSIGERKLIDWAAPRGRMPMFILGGKGSGKTHLMRYLSLQLQQLRHAESLVEGLRHEGFIGIYLRCSGLNAGRFSRKGQTDEVWRALFAQYMDLWLAQLTLATFRVLRNAAQISAKQERVFCEQAADILRLDATGSDIGLDVIEQLLRQYQRQIDAAVNNAAVTRSLDVSIRTTPGTTVFSLPKLMLDCVPAIAELQVLYLVDEIENFDDSQQRYLNTLIRERVGPVSLRVGGRTWGVKTQRTLASDEENKRGSEYEVLYLDQVLRTEEKAYKHFCRELVRMRLAASGFLPGIAAQHLPDTSLDGAFTSPERTPFSQAETSFVLKRSGERPYFGKLRRHLEDGFSRGLTPGITRREQIDAIVIALRNDAFPLVEKATLMLFYRDWSNREDLIRATSRLAEAARTYIVAPDEEGRVKSLLEHFRADLLSQLRRDYQLSQQYVGLDTFIALSSGLPRNLLILLKYIFEWAVYRGEQPFGDTPISEESQRLGVIEASQWFYSDFQVRGDVGEAVDRSIQRLATLFRAIRYSEKPSECSLIAFSINYSQLSDDARQMLEWAETRTLLIPIRGGRRSKNSERIDHKYELNGMLSPRWDLPASRRGSIELPVHEGEAIFVHSSSDAFDQLLVERVSRMSAPAFGRAVRDDIHPLLPGFDDA